MALHAHVAQRRAGKGTRQAPSGAVKLARGKYLIAFAMSCCSCTDVDTPEPGQYDSPASRAAGTSRSHPRCREYRRNGRPRMADHGWAMTRAKKGDREQLPDEEVALTARLHRLGER